MRIEQARARLGTAMMVLAAVAVLIASMAMAVAVGVGGGMSAPSVAMAAERSGNTNSPCILPLPKLEAATPMASPVVDASPAVDASPVVSPEVTEEPVAADGTERLAGLLGGSLDSWVATYGEGTEDSTATVQDYLWKGCGPGTQATFANGVTVWVSLWSHRPEDSRAGRIKEADDQNWTQEDALTIAKALLPSDIVLDAPMKTEQGNIRIHGTSAIMSEDIGWDTYGIAGVSSTPGEFEILLTLDPNGRVYELDVALRGYTVG